jgi:DNA polymerase-3 subunit epsilon
MSLIHKTLKFLGFYKKELEETSEPDAEHQNVQKTLSDINQNKNIEDKQIVEKIQQTDNKEDFQTKPPAINFDFVAIDFETADQNRNNPCALGIAFVEKGRVKEVRHWYIKPPCYPNFNLLNVAISGITPEMVQNAPTFDELWEEILHIFDNKIIAAHNAKFDIGVLISTLNHYNIALPNIEYFCSYEMSKQAFRHLSSHKLNDVCHHLGIALEHHQADSDCVACAEIILKASEQLNIVSIDDLRNSSYIRKLDPVSIPKKSERVVKSNQNLTQSSLVFATQEEVDKITDLKDKVFVFSGNFSQLKDTLKSLAISKGCIVKDSVSKKIDFLVCGTQNKKVVGEDGLSGKEEKVIEINSKGGNIKVLDEEQFMYLMNK